MAHDHDARHFEQPQNGRIGAGFAQDRKMTKNDLSFLINLAFF